MGPNIERLNVEWDRTSKDWMSKDRTSNGTEPRKTEHRKGPNIERLNIEKDLWHYSITIFDPPCTVQYTYFSSQIFHPGPGGLEIISPALWCSYSLPFPVPFPSPFPVPFSFPFSFPFHFPFPFPVSFPFSLLLSFSIFVSLFGT